MQRGRRGELWKNHFNGDKYRRKKIDSTLAESNDGVTNRVDDAVTGTSPVGLSEESNHKSPLSLAMEQSAQRSSEKISEDIIGGSVETGGESQEVRSKLGEQKDTESIGEPLGQQSHENHQEYDGEGAEPVQDPNEEMSEVGTKESSQNPVKEEMVQKNKMDTLQGAGDGGVEMSDTQKGEGVHAGEQRMEEALEVQVQPENANQNGGTSEKTESDKQEHGGGAEPVRDPHEEMGEESTQESSQNPVKEEMVQKNNMDTLQGAGDGGVEKSGTQKGEGSDAGEQQSEEALEVQVQPENANQNDDTSEQSESDKQGHGEDSLPQKQVTEAAVQQNDDTAGESDSATEISEEQQEAATVEDEVPSTAEESNTLDRYRSTRGYKMQLTAFERIGTAQAYRNIARSLGSGVAPGEGITIGVVDDGVEFSHLSFEGKVGNVANYDIAPLANEGDDTFSHGTAVASLIAAAQRFKLAITSKNNRFLPQGVAFGANIVSLDIRGKETKDRPIGSLFQEETIFYPAEAVMEEYIPGRDLAGREILQWTFDQESLDIMNFSTNILGGRGFMEYVTERDIRDHFSDSIEVLAQEDEDDPVLLVFAAGNSHRGHELCVGDGGNFACTKEEKEKKFGWDDADNHVHCPKNGEWVLCDRDADDWDAYEARITASLNEKYRASSPEWTMSLAARIPEMRGHSVTVVALDYTPLDAGPAAIADYSNRCGVAADWCIAAPGTRIQVAIHAPFDRRLHFFEFDQYYWSCEDESDRATCVLMVPMTKVPGRNDGYLTIRESGTSFSAALVSGGLALVMQAFGDQLSSSEVLTRLFTTADKQGIYSDRSIYGQGKMDLGAATSPVGGTSILLGQDITKGGTALSETMLLASEAFGASPGFSLAGGRVAAFDNLGAPFWYDLGSFVRTSGRPLIASRLRSMLVEDDQSDSDGEEEVLLLTDTSILPSSTPVVSLGLVTKSPGFSGVAGPAVAMSWSDRDGPLSISAFTTEGRAGQPRATGASLDWSPFGLRTGLVAERNSSLGAVANGGFGRLSASTAFVGVGRNWQHGSWRIGADLEVGFSNPSTNKGMLQEMRTMTATRFKVNAMRDSFGGGSMRLALEQPLRVERGRAALRVPVGRTKSGDILYNEWDVNLSPRGRQVDFAASWYGPSVKEGQIRFGSVLSFNPGHDESAPPDYSLLAGYRINF